MHARYVNNLFHYPDQPSPLSPSTPSQSLAHFIAYASTPSHEAYVLRDFHRSLLVAETQEPVYRCPLSLQPLPFHLCIYDCFRLGPSGELPCRVPTACFGHDDKVIVTLAENLATIFFQQVLVYCWSGYVRPPGD